MNVSTGISSLDKLIGGGFPLDSAILLIGPPGTGKTTLCQQFLYNGLQKSEKGIYITSDSSPEDVISTMNGFSWDIKSFIREMKLMFLDMYSWRAGGAEEEKWKRVIKGGLDIDTLNLTLSEVLRSLTNSNQKRGIFDSLSTMLLYIPTEVVIRFIPIFIAKIKKQGITGVLVLEEGVHDEKTVNTLNFMTDGLIETKLEGNSKFMRIPRMRGTKSKGEWVEYDLSKNGLIFK